MQFSRNLGWGLGTTRELLHFKTCLNTPRMVRDRSGEVPKNVYRIAALEEGVDDAVVEALPGGVVEEADEEGQAAALSQLHPME